MSEYSRIKYGHKGALSLPPGLAHPSRQAVPSRTPRSPCISPRPCAPSVTASRNTQTRSSGGLVPPPPPPAPSYQQRSNAPHSPPENPYHIQNCSANSRMPSRNPSPHNPGQIPALKHQSLIPSSQSVPPSSRVTNPPAVFHKSYLQSHSLQSHRILRRAKSRVLSCLKFIFPTVSTALPDIHSYPSRLYLLSHSTSIYHHVRPSPAFSTQPSTQGSPFLLSQFPRRESCCPSSVTSRFQPRPKLTAPMPFQSWSHLIPHLRPLLSPHSAAPRRRPFFHLPIPYIHSLPTCECHPCITTHFFYLV